MVFGIGICKLIVGIVYCAVLVFIVETTNNSTHRDCCCGRLWFHLPVKVNFFFIQGAFDVVIHFCCQYLALRVRQFCGPVFIGCWQYCAQLLKTIGVVGSIVLNDLTIHILKSKQT